MTAPLELSLQPKSWLPAQAEASWLAEDPSGPKDLRWVLLSGGQGSGKTWWLCWAGLRLYFRAITEAQRSGIALNQVHGILLSPTLQLLKKTALPTLQVVMSECGLRQGVHYDVNRQEGILTFEWGGQIYFFTAEKPEGIIGVNAVVAMVDEPGTPKTGESLARVAGRMRGPTDLRVVVMAGTPEDIITRQHFFDFIASPEAQERYGEQGDGTRRVVFARTADNVHIRGLDAYIQGQRSVLTKAQQDAYLEGRFVAFNKGRVYGAYIDRDHEAGGHMVKRKHELLTPPARGNELLISLDFNVDPMCGVIGWRVGEAVLYADEIRIPNAGDDGMTPIGQWCKEAIERWVGKWEGPVAVYGDATEKRQTVASSTTGWAIVHDALGRVVRAHGWEYLNGVWGSNPREIDRVNTVNKAFEDRKVLVAESCVYLRKDLNMVGFKPGTNQIDKDSDKNLTHLSDALGYAIVQRGGLLATRRPGEAMPPILAHVEPGFHDRCEW